MREIISLAIGVLLGMFAQAQALDVKLEAISVRDLMAASALSSLIEINDSSTMSVKADLAWKYAETMMRKR